MASEVGVVDVPNWDIASKGRLMPGNIFLVDFEEGRVIKDEEVQLVSQTSCLHDFWPPLLPGKQPIDDTASMPNSEPYVLVPAANMGLTCTPAGQLHCIGRASLLLKCLLTGPCLWMVV